MGRLKIAYNKKIMANQINEVEKLRLMTKLNQTDFAKLVGTTQRQFSRYESGKSPITLEKLKLWCDILEIDIKKLF